MNLVPCTNLLRTLPLPVLSLIASDYRHDGSSMLLNTVYGSRRCDMSQSPFGKSLLSAADDDIEHEK